MTTSFKIQSDETCPSCGKVAIELSRRELKLKNRTDLIISLACGHTVGKRGEERKDYSKIISSDKRKLYPYQVIGCEFIEKTGFRAGIFDEQGLGKTIQAIAPIKDNPSLHPFVVLCKSGLKIQFFSELVRWIGPEYFAQIIEKPTDILLRGIKGYIFSHDILRNFSMDKLESIKAQYVIIDECQAFKNPESARTKKMSAWVKTIPHVVATSGTPIKNRPSEYFTILNTLSPMKFPSDYLFKRIYIRYEYNGDGKLKEVGLRNEKRFNEETAEFVIRRQRNEVFKELPTINRQFFNVDLEDETKQAYAQGEKKLAAMIDNYNESMDQQEYANVMAEINRLRQIIGVAKVKYCADYLNDLLDNTDKKVTIFLHHKATARFLIELLKLRGETPLQIEGGTSIEKRAQVQKAFADPKGNRVLVASTLAAGEGLNLQYQCYTCIILERQWNPANEEQAEARFTRPDSPKMGGSIDSIYMIAPGTIDEYLTSMVEQKRQILDEVINKRKTIWNENELMRELLSAVERKHNANRSGRV